MKKFYYFLGILFLFSNLIQAQTRQVKGIVSAETGETLPGVSVKLKGNASGTSTDAKGNFSLTVPDNNAAILIFSYVGFKEQEVAVNKRSQITVVLSSDTKSLNEVVVVGYGTVRKRDLTGSVASVKGEEINKVPSTSVMESVQGKIPGVDVTRTSGAAGANSTVTIRGNRSITASNGPLYIIDGVQYLGAGANPQQDISPNDIESMEVLKDASSTAIYGARGANGVIIITTKKGAIGQAKISFNSYVGVSHVADYPEVLDAQGYVDLKREANRTNNRWNSEADDKVIFNSSELANIASGAVTNFPDLLLHNGLQQDYELGVQAGTDKTSIYLSADYYNEKGLFKLDNLDRYSGRFNIDYTFNKYFKIGAQNQITYYDQDTRRDPLNLATKIDPLTPAYNPDGSLIIYPNQGKDISPLADEQPDAYQNNSLTSRLFSVGYIELKPVTGLTLRSNVGITLTGFRRGIYASPNTIDRNGSASQASQLNANNRYISWENIITYQKQIKQHSFTLTGVTSYLTNKADSSSAQGRNQLLSSQLYYGLANAPDNVAIASSYGKETTISFAGRLNYNFKGKYLLTLTGRGDGSSKLAEGNKWAFFPSAAAAWRVSDEAFMQKQKVFSDLKLRVSYGLAGNDAVPKYATQGVLSKIPMSFGEASASGYGYNPKAKNPDLQWEYSKTFDLGFDVGFVDNRISLTMDYYNTSTDRLLLLRSLPQSSGYDNIVQNVGKTHNRGFELSLSTTNIASKNLRWTSNIYYYRNKEEVTDLVGGVQNLNIGSASNPRFLVVGYPVNSFYDYQKTGIWQTNQADAAAAFGQKPGDISVKDQNGDGKITALDDRVVVGSQVPVWSGGFNNDLRYKGFDFNIYFYARIGQTINSEYYGKYDPQGIENSANIHYWTPENPSNEYPRPNSNLSKATMLYTSTLGYSKASFVKLRSASIGYTIPSALLKKIYVRNLRVYVTGKNLGYFSKIKDFDPETLGAFANPLPRTFMAGINLGF
ncbi:SusC/RagA family TonB-linked outer membrane protein [Pedobacter sp. HMF7647]|uniref:SusC/RagA family TonB-linked outer membrane protein n=1 Tax=Hufsiella arboris TaxID=2695275 RepID=A0A7K1Y4I2_9SPHI|nr:TonB-dependent receptor [Hufsiella arboris]MXV49487.1 SusC/RagA family TonB-linked outer membrane protein [Hufsiella arboris]